LAQSDADHFLQRIILMDLLKTKTFWIGIVTLAAGIIEACFSDGEQFSFSLTTLLSSEKVLLGLGMITGRHALLKMGRSGK